MLTPGFELSQNDEFLIVNIQIPYAKISEVEVHFEDIDFMFYSSPYYLRLNLPGKVQYLENPVMDFNLDKKIMTIKAPKAEHGQVFEGLDLITNLLAPKKNKTAASPVIEVIDGIDGIPDDEDFDWSIEQTPCDEFNIHLHGDQYGFANSYSPAVFKLKEEIREIFDINEPLSDIQIRRKKRFEIESDHFDQDHYIADLYHDEEIQQLLKYHPEWEDLYDKMQSTPSISSDQLIHFTSEEKDKLRKLPNKEYILDKNEVKVAFLGLIDILFAYAYDKRTTEDESTVESAWTINKLSATLSGLETFSSIPEVALSCIRRSLCYPLFRHFELSVTILEDVRKIILLGRKYVIKCLLEIHSLFNLSEPRYILNDLFITDYCVWVQSKRCSSNKLTPLASILEKVLITKGDINLNLVDIESFAAIACMAHNNEMKRLPDSIGKEKKPENSEDLLDDNDTLCLEMEKLTFQQRQSDSEGCSSNIGNCNSLLNNCFSEYESCSTCSSGSVDSSSNTCESDSDCSVDTTTASESDDDTASSSDSDDDDDDDDLKYLLKKENEERLR